MNWFVEVSNNFGQTFRKIKFEAKLIYMNGNETIIRREKSNQFLEKFAVKTEQ